MSSVTVASVQFDGLPGHVDANRRSGIGRLNGRPTRMRVTVRRRELALDERGYRDWRVIERPVDLHPEVARLPIRTRVIIGISRRQDGD